MFARPAAERAEGSKMDEAATHPSETAMKSGLSPMTGDEYLEQLRDGREV